MRYRLAYGIASIAAISVGLAARSMAETIVLDPRVNVIELDASNCIGSGLTGGNAEYKLRCTGVDPHWGSPDYARWLSVVHQYQPVELGIDYQVVPVGGLRGFRAYHLGNCFLTDGEDSLWDNWGQADLEILDEWNRTKCSGTIYANQNVVQHNETIMPKFTTSQALGRYRIQASGTAKFGGASYDVYHSAVVTFHTASHAIDYAAVPVGGEIEVYGYDVRAFLTDGKGAIWDNGGSLSLTLTPAATDVETITIDPRVNVIGLDSTNSLDTGLSGNGATFSIESIGDPHWGSPNHARWLSAVHGYLGPAPDYGKYYQVVPMAGAKQWFTAHHLGQVCLTDGEGSKGDNWGQADVAIRTASGEVAFSGTIIANDNVAEHNATTMQQFFTSSSVDWYRVAASGEARYGGALNDLFNQVVVAYHTADHAIDYAVVPVGGSVEVYGYDLRVFITDAKGSTGDNSGSLTMTLKKVGAQLRAEALLGDFLDTNRQGVPVTIELRDPNTHEALRTIESQLDADGQFDVVCGLRTGFYDVAVKCSHWLRVVRYNVELKEGVNPLERFVLGANGDCDGDNSITVFDYNCLSDAFDSVPGDPNWDERADLDGDGTVNGYDYNILSKNFDEVGEP